MILDFKNFVKHFSEEIDGRYTEYDENQSVIIIPLKDGRFQAVTGHKAHHPPSGRDIIHIKSKICKTSEEIPYVDILQANSDYPYARFVIEDDFLKVEAIEFTDHLDETQIKEMMYEVANLADEWEYKITGEDVQ